MPELPINPETGEPEDAEAPNEVRTTCYKLSSHTSYCANEIAKQEEKLQ